MIRAILLLLFWSISILIVGPLLVIHAAITGNVLPLYRIASWLGITGVKLVGVKIVLQGVENLQPGQSYIFMSNHVSNLDPPILLPSIPGRCSVLVKKELFRTPIFGIGMRQADLVPVDRSNREAAIESMQAAVQVLRQRSAHVDLSRGHAIQRRALVALQKRPVSSGNGVWRTGGTGDAAGDLRKLA